MTPLYVQPLLYRAHCSVLTEFCLLRLPPNWVAMWPSPIVQIIRMKNVFYQCAKNLKLTNLLQAAYCNFCSIIKPEPLSWTGSLSFAFLWVIHLQTSALFWCITMIDWRVHVIYHDSQQLLDAKDWESEPAVSLMCSHNASQLRETDNVLLQNDTTQKRKSPEVQILYNEAFEVWNRAANSWSKMLVINQLSIVFHYLCGYTGTHCCLISSASLWYWFCADQR